MQVKVCLVQDLFLFLGTELVACYLLNLFRTMLPLSLFLPSRFAAVKVLLYPIDFLSQTNLIALMVFFWQVKSRMMGDSAYKSTIDCFVKTLKNDVCFLFFDSNRTRSFIQWVGWVRKGTSATYRKLQKCDIKFGDFWCHFAFLLMLLLWGHCVWDGLAKSFCNCKLIWVCSHWCMDHNSFPGKKKKKKKEKQRSKRFALHYYILPWFLY